MPIFLLAAFRGDFDEAEFGERLVVLRDLVSLGEVGVEIVLAGKDRSLIDAAVQGHGCERGELDSSFVEHGERAGHSEADGADIRIRWGAEFRGARAEDLGRRQELDVDFKSDDRLELGMGGDGIFRSGGHRSKDYKGRKTSHHRERKEDGD